MYVLNATFKRWIYLFNIGVIVTRETTYWKLYRKICRDWVSFAVNWTNFILRFFSHRQYPVAWIHSQHLQQNRIIYEQFWLLSHKWAHPCSQSPHGNWCQSSVNKIQINLEVKNHDNIAVYSESVRRSWCFFKIDETKRGSSKMVNKWLKLSPKVHRTI